MSMRFGCILAFEFVHWRTDGNVKIFGQIRDENIQTERLPCIWKGTTIGIKCHYTQENKMDILPHLL